MPNSNFPYWAGRSGKVLTLDDDVRNPSGLKLPRSQKATLDPATVQWTGQDATFTYAPGTPPPLIWYRGEDIPQENCVAAYAPDLAVNSVLSDTYIDRTGNGHTITVGTAPSWSASTRWIFNGTTQYLKTGISIPNDGTYSVVIVAQTAPLTAWDTPVGGAWFGWQKLSGQWNGVCMLQNFPVFAFMNGRQTASGLLLRSSTVGTSPVLFGIHGNNYRIHPRIAIGGGTPTDVVGTAADFTESHELYIGASNNLSAARLYQACDIFFVCIYNIVLTTTQINDVWNGWANRRNS